MKVCIECSEAQPASEFPVKERRARIDGSIAHYYRPECKTCRNLNERLNRYGLSRKDWEKLCEDYSCKICGKDDDGELCVDHDHNTGKVRGLLCHTCNKGLGLLYDSPKLLRNAITYLNQETVT